MTPPTELYVFKDEDYKDAEVDLFPSEEAMMFHINCLPSGTGYSYKVYKIKDIELVGGGLGVVRLVDKEHFTKGDSDEG